MDLSFRVPDAINLRVLARLLAPHCDLAQFWAFAKADWEGRSPCPERYPYSLEEFLEIAGGQKGPLRIPLQARDLMAALGLSGGPTVGRLLKIVKSAYDLGRISTVQEGLELAAEVLGDPLSLETRFQESPSLAGVDLASSGP
jgi:hypothetical protein